MNYSRNTDEVKARVYPMIADMNIDKAVEIKENTKERKIETNLF